MGIFSFEADGDTLTIKSTATAENQEIRVSEAAPQLIVGGVASKGTDTVYHRAKAEIAFGALSKKQVWGKGIITINNQTNFFVDRGEEAANTDFTVNVAGITGSQSLVAAIANQLGDVLDGITLTASDSILTLTVTARGKAGNGIVISDGAEIGIGASQVNLLLIST